MKKTESNQIKFSDEPISIVEVVQNDESEAVSPQSNVAKPAKANSPNSAEIQDRKNRFNYWSVVEFLLAFVAPFFIETSVIWFLEYFFPYHRSDFAKVTPVSTVFMVLSGMRIVAPVVGLVIAILLSKQNKSPKFVFLFWLGTTTVFVFAWVLYCRTVNTYWM
jgi:hypothetical protein